MFVLNETVRNAMRQLERELVKVQSIHTNVDGKT